MGLKNKKGDGMAARALISVRIEEEDREKLDAVVKKTGGDLSSVVRNIIAGHFAKAIEKRFAEKKE